MKPNPAPRRLHFVGPLPPPLHGFSFVNAAMLARLQALAPVAVFDRAPRPWWQQARLALCSFGALFGRRAGGVYLCLSGGLGQWLDLPAVLAARLLGRPVLVHHHSFAYIHRRPLTTRLVMALLRPARHIALCSCMADALSQRYRIARAQVDVLSNAAFLPPPQHADSTAADAAGARSSADAGGLRRLGFLSNITAEKGIWQLFELADALRARGLAFELDIAGPVAAALAPRLAQALSARPWCRHRGAVHGADKAGFFASIDLLVFPTLYANEAEPVVLLEALAAGVPVLANARGCIAELVPATAGAVLHGDAQFVAEASARVQQWQAEGAAAWAARRAAARAAFAALHAQASLQLQVIVARTLAAGTGA